MGDYLLIDIYNQSVAQVMQYKLKRLYHKEFP